MKLQLNIDTDKAEDVERALQLILACSNYDKDKPLTNEEIYRLLEGE